MAKKPEEQAGSGIDKPDPKTVMEKVGDTLKSVFPNKVSPEKVSPIATENGTIQRISK